MLIISHEAYIALTDLRRQSQQGQYIDKSEDRYTIFPNGDIYVSWLQDAEEKYTQVGGFVGNMPKPKSNGVLRV